MHLGNFSDIQNVPPTKKTPTWVYVVPAILGSLGLVALALVITFIVTKIILHQKISEREENWKGVENSGVDTDKKLEVV